MHELVFDIETNAIEDWDELSDLRVIHCIAIQEPRSDQVDVYSDSYGEDKNLIHGLIRLGMADRIIGHNIDRFDLKAIKKFYPSFSFANCHSIDTLLASRIMSPDVVRTDCQDPEFPTKLRGRYSLEAWGHRLKFNKGDFGKQTDWSVFTPEMADYCAQDVRLNSKLWLEIRKTFVSEVYAMERDFRDILIKQEENGVVFDEEAAFKLHTELIGQKIDLEKKLTEIFPAQEEHMKTPQYYFDPSTDERYERKKDAPHAIKKVLKPGPLRKRVVPFNPGSRIQIANALIKMYDWKPSEFTGDGRPKVDETVLTKLKYPEAKVLSQYLMICKRIGQLSEGKESWIRSSREGRIHGHVQSIGTVSARCSHSRPNLAQVPALGSPFGSECRELFKPTPGMLMVGCDMSGLELRCLAHYLAKWDKGEYIKVIQEGDIHQFNADKMGVDRGVGKGIMYATLYGAGDAKIGQLVGGGRREGRHMRNMLESGIPALKMLKRAIKNRLKTQDWLPAIDGRRLPIRSDHAALNLLLQSAGSILMKQATIKMNRYIRQNKLQANQIMHVHDEVQFEAFESEAEDVGRIAVQSMREAGEPYEFRCPLDGEYKIGHSWADTH
tara:strand:- start:12870 stop:14696 length:1827 start_codon:yes stop_codon:yes gene_type:complete